MEKAVEIFAKMLKHAIMHNHHFRVRYYRSQLLICCPRAMFENKNVANNYNNIDDNLRARRAA
jgi:hypothetical protein